MEKKKEVLVIDFDHPRLPKPMPTWVDTEIRNGKSSLLKEDNPQEMRQMIAYCGLDCEKCDAFIATKNNDQALREKTAKLWAELNNAPILPEHINCEGCRMDGVKTVFCSQLCAIRQCAIKKGVTTCGDCPDMADCPTLATVTANSREALKNLTE